jgi:hypothetical protein
MALTYGSKNVDSRFSPILEPILFNRNIFQEGLSYTAKYDINEAGEVFVRLLGKGAAVVGTPGSKFTDGAGHTDTADTVVAIPRNKSFLRSEEIFDAVAADTNYDTAASHLETALRVVQEAWNTAIFGELVTGTPLFGTRVPVTGAALTKDTIYESVIDSVAVLQLAKANPTVMIVPPISYAKLLKSPEFLRSTDLGDEVVETGMIGQMAGLRVFLSQDAVAYDYVIYDHDALAVNSRVDAFRLKDAIDFPGVYAQVKIDAGIKVTNADRVLTRATNGVTTTTTAA